MGVSSLLNVPKTAEDWAKWSLNHKIQHDNIISAIATQKTVKLQPYLLDPINFSYPDLFLQNNSQAHTDMNSTMKTQGTDLLEVNLSEERQLASWIYSHWLEHNTINQALGI